MALLDIDEARAAIQVDDTDTSIDEDTLQGLVDSVTSIFEEYKGEVIDQRTVTEHRTFTGSAPFVLSSVPVISLTSGVSFDGETTWDLDTVTVDSSGVVDVLSGCSPRGRFVVTYEAGYADPPARYKEAAKLAVRDLWNVYRGVGIQESEVEQFDPDMVLTRRTRMLLGPPRPALP